MDIALLRNSLSYNAETGEFIWRVRRGSVFPGQRAGKLRKDGYRTIQFCGKAWGEHVLAWAYKTGELPPSGMQIDHVNLNKADNRLVNLRLATRSQQQANTRISSRNKYGSKGIAWRKDCKKWRAEIYVNQRAISLGLFASIDAAAAAYQAASRKYYGDFSRA